jgi:hypothetical protein
MFEIDNKTIETFSLSELQIKLLKTNKYSSFHFYKRRNLYILKATSQSPTDDQYFNIDETSKFEYFIHRLENPIKLPKGLC